jgi:hypothetical protein
MVVDNPIPSEAGFALFTVSSPNDQILRSLRDIRGSSLVSAKKPPRFTVYSVFKRAVSNCRDRPSDFQWRLLAQSGRSCANSIS